MWIVLKVLAFKIEFHTNLRPCCFVAWIVWKVTAFKKCFPPSLSKIELTLSKKAFALGEKVSRSDG